MSDEETLADHKDAKTSVGISAQDVTVTYRNGHTALWSHYGVRACRQRHN